MLTIMNYFRTYFFIFLLVSLAACGGRVPAETIVHQVGDEEKTCDELKIELDYLEVKAEELVAKTDKTTRNLGLVALATEEPLSLVFMDLSLADKRELSALKKRYNHLVRLALAKECKPPAPPATSPPKNINELINSEDTAEQEATGGE